MSESLSNLDKEKTILRYTQRFAEHGFDPKSLGWGIKGRQKERFKILIDIINIDCLNNLKVADIGAGFGDLYNFMIKNDIQIKEYFGYELVPSLVEEGRKQYGDNKNFKLINVDYLYEEEIDLVDISIISGSFNFKLEGGDNYTYIRNILKKAFINSKHGVAANFITNRTDFNDKLIFYAIPRK